MSKPNKIIVDGMLSGTGLRDGVRGGYLKLEDVGVSRALSNKIRLWLSAYADEHYQKFERDAFNAVLDKEGIELARMLREEISEVEVEYFSNAYMKRLPLD